MFESFFKSICEGNVVAVREFLATNASLAPISNAEGKSAAKVALESKQIEVYEALMINGWNLNPNEDFYTIVNSFEYVLKEKLHQVHKQFVKNPNEKHLTSLITRTSIYYGGSPATNDRRIYLDKIAGAYEELNDIREIRAIFKVASHVENLNIVFDFDRDSVEHMDATGSPGVKGKVYAEIGDVYVGAEPLLRSEERYKALGVLAHELCHYAVFYKYNNDCKPYFKDDQDQEDFFEKVFETCAEHRQVEDIIDAALNEDFEIVHDELIVRVPHILAHYKENKDKIKDLKKPFWDLFDFFDKKTLPDLESEDELMTAVWKLKMKEPQHLTDSIISFEQDAIKFDLKTSKVCEISSNCPQVTINLIYQNMINNRKPRSSFIFLGLYHLKDQQTFNLTTKALNSCLKPTIIVDCDNETTGEIVKVFKAVKSVGINERMIFVHDKEEFLSTNAEKLSHSWLELSKASKENLIKRKISFQGHEILLDKVADLKSESLNHIPLKQLLDNNLKINEDLQFSEIDIHINRSFMNQNSEEIKLSELLSLVKDNKVLLLSDDPGMGKTTELKTIAMKMNENHQTDWVAFIDLKMYSEFYDEDENVKTRFDSAEDVASFFTEKILKLSIFEAETFKQLFRLARVVLLLDGFDEISPTYNKFITRLLKAITKTSNLLVTSTRPHFKDELRKLLDVQPYKLKPLTKENCNEIVRLSFEKMKIHGEDLETKIFETKKFYHNLNKNSDVVMNPLLLRMIARVFTNDEVAKATQPNTYSIYENFVKMMIVISMDKGHDAKHEAAEYIMSESNIMPFHQKEAFKELFQNAADEVKKRISLCFFNVQSPHDEQMTRIALMKSYGEGKFPFIHRTFTEFFVADFLFKSIFDLKVLEAKNLKGKELVNATHELFREVFYAGSGVDVFYPVRVFIDGAFENFIANVEKLDKGCISRLRKSLHSMFCELFTPELLPRFFTRFFEDSLINMITVITSNVKHDKRKLKKLWSDLKLVENDKNLLMIAAEHGSLYFNTKLVELARGVFDEKDFQKYLSQQNKNGEVVSLVAVKRSTGLGVNEFYLELSPPAYESFSDKRLIWLEESLDLHLLGKLLQFKSIDRFEAKLVEIQNVHDLDYVRRVVNAPTVDGRSIYYDACKYCLRTIDEFEKFWQILQNVLGESGRRDFLLKPQNDGVTPLMMKVFQPELIFNAFWNLITESSTPNEKKSFLTHEDCEGSNLFEWASKSSDLGTFIVIKNLYVETFGRDEMTEMLTRKKPNGKNILILSVPMEFDNVETITALWIFIQELYNEAKLKKLVLHKDNEGRNFYHRSLNNRYFEEKMKIFESFIEDTLTENEKKTLKTPRVEHDFKILFKTVVDSFITDIKDWFLYLFDLFNYLLQSLVNIFNRTCNKQAQQNK